MSKYLVIHNKHEGCYEFKSYQDEAARIRLTSITINPPKIFMFNNRENAQEFFEEYINDVDCIDFRCRKGEEVEHIEYCTCGVIELDENEEPVLFYNKRNQIFLLEHGPEVFMPNQELKNDIRNLNLTNRLIRKCKSLPYEQRKKYIELGKICEDCNIEEDKKQIQEQQKDTKEQEPQTQEPQTQESETQEPQTQESETQENQEKEEQKTILHQTTENVLIPEKKKRAPRKPKSEKKL
jgi:hypothetical protein